jgi:hypothetical protein
VIPLRVALSLLVFAIGCGNGGSADGSTDPENQPDAGAGTGGAGGTGTGGTGTGGTGTGGTGTGGTGTGGTGTGGTGTGGAGTGGTGGTGIGGVPTALPPVAPMTNVVAVENDDSVSITFDPVEGAKDYRVYPLPQDEDIEVGADGKVVVKNAIYRCAGNREAPAPTVDDGPESEGSWVTTLVDQQTVGGHLRTLADATLGYVYTEPGPGRVPVYSLGESDANADNLCIFARWAASRTKRYTTDESERAQLLDEFARDDGILFYAPETADATTRQVHYDEDGSGTQYTSRFYFVDGPEADAHTGKKPAFLVLAEQAPGTQPLMRVFYQNNCGWSHDELAVGTERFQRIYRQGDQLPWWSLTWSGITEPTTLVVEALDEGCPYQGHLAAESLPAVTGQFGDMEIPHPAYQTLDELRAASSTTEVFVNGQHGATNQPKAIARAFLNVAPKPHPEMDFFADFDVNTPAEAFSPIDCGAPTGNCYQTWRAESPTWDAIFMNVESGPSEGTGLYTMGPMLGELWVNYADVAADTNGRFRLTPKQKATMSASSYLHVTMEVDAVSSARRYPQILISDRNAPVQYTLAEGHTLVVQPRAITSAWLDWPIDYELQVCNLRPWDVNDQCPVYDLHQVKDSEGTVIRLAPHDELGEFASVDSRVIFDVYASTERAYLFLNKKPYGCAELPSGVAPSGEVTVTYGDVLYHSGVDHTFAFHKEHMQVDARRHYDNLGFSSGVSAPAWDETRLPCAPAITL